MFTSLYDSFIVNPLRRLYLNGPKLLGFWEGQGLSSICHTLTNHPEIFWVEHAEECENMVNNKFTSFLNTFEVLLYFYLLYRGAQKLKDLCCALPARLNPKPTYYYLPIANVERDNHPLSHTYLPAPVVQSQTIL